MRYTMYETYLFSNDGKEWEEHTLTRVDKHIYPFCAGYQRFKAIKQIDQPEKKVKGTYKMKLKTREVSAIINLYENLNQSIKSHGGSTWSWAELQEMSVTDLICMMAPNVDPESHYFKVKASRPKNDNTKCDGVALEAILS